MSTIGPATDSIFVWHYWFWFYGGDDQSAGEGAVGEASVRVMVTLSNIVPASLLKKKKHNQL